MNPRQRMAQRKSLAPQSLRKKRKSIITDQKSKAGNTPADNKPGRGRGGQKIMFRTLYDYELQVNVLQVQTFLEPFDPDEVDQPNTETTAPLPPPTAPAAADSGDEAEPAAEEPAAEEPAAEEPVVEEPAAVEEPVAEEPAAEEPVVEEAAAEEPVVEEPAAVEEPVAATEEPAAVEEPVAAAVEAKQEDEEEKPKKSYFVTVSVDQGEPVKSAVKSCIVGEKMYFNEALEFDCEQEKPKYVHFNLYEKNVLADHAYVGKADIDVLAEHTDDGFSLPKKFWVDMCIDEQGIVSARMQISLNLLAIKRTVAVAQSSRSKVRRSTTRFSLAVPRTKASKAQSMMVTNKNGLVPPTEAKVAAAAAAAKKKGRKGVLMRMKNKQMEVDRYFTWDVDTLSLVTYKTKELAQSVDMFPVVDIRRLVQAPQAVHKDYLIMNLRNGDACTLMHPNSKYRQSFLKQYEQLKVKAAEPKPAPDDSKLQTQRMRNGELSIFLSHGQGLKMCSGFSDPYCLLTTDNTTADKVPVLKSAVTKNTVYPCYQQEFVLEVSDPSQEVLSVVIKDLNTFLFKDEYMGEARVPIVDVAKAMELPLTAYPVYDEKGYTKAWTAWKAAGAKGQKPTKKQWGVLNMALAFQTF